MENKYKQMPYSELINKAYIYLDKIDFKPYINAYTDLHDLVHAIEDDYDNTELTNNDFLQGCIFNWLAEDEISTYIKKKYNVNYREETIIRYVRGNL